MYSSFFNRLRTTMYFMDEKQREPIPRYLERLPLNLIKYFTDIVCVSLPPAGPTGCMFSELSQFVKSE